MPAKKKAKTASGEKLYSFDEYRKEFGVITERQPSYEAASPKDFGIHLAQEALKKVKQDLEKK